MPRLILDHEPRNRREFIKAPDFSLSADDGSDWRLFDFSGQVVALLFYPKNETLICTRQLCSVRDNWTDYLATKAEIVAISPGTPDEHRSFSENHRLPLRILADEKGSVTSQFCLKYNWMPVWLTRAVIIVDAEGKIRYRRIMPRARRPSNYSVLRAIYESQTDFRLQKFDSILAEHKKRRYQIF